MNNWNKTFLDIILRNKPLLISYNFYNFCVNTGNYFKYTFDFSPYILKGYSSWYKHFFGSLLKNGEHLLFESLERGIYVNDFSI